MKLWVRYIVCKFWSTFALLLSGTFLFYAAVHFSLHTIRNGSPISASYYMIALYYLSEIMLKSEFLLFQLVAISVVIVLSSMQSKREILLLRSSGLSLKKILMPLITSGVIVCGLLYCHFEWLFPRCEYVVSSVNLFSNKKKVKLPAFYLKDQSILLCSSIDKNGTILNDVFWIKKFSNVYKIKELQLGLGVPPLGIGVLAFKRDENEKLCLDHMYEQKEFPEIEFGPYENPCSKIFISNTTNRLSGLFKAIYWKSFYFGSSTLISSRNADLMTQFYYKLFSPLICLSAVIIPASICLQFKKTQTYSYAYLFSLLILNLFFLCFKALCVLSKHNIIPPLQASLVPILILLTMTWRSLVKVNH